MHYEHSLGVQQYWSHAPPICRIAAPAIPTLDDECPGRLNSRSILRDLRLDVGSTLAGESSTGSGRCVHRRMFLQFFFVWRIFLRQTASFPDISTEAFCRHLTL
jgi:hypothetical protein